MKKNSASDNIITPFVQNRIYEGYSVVQKNGTDVLDLCPNKKCGKSYYYTFTKNGITLKACPHCKHCEITRKATREDFKAGTTLIDSEGYTFTILRKYSQTGIWEARGQQGQGEKCVFDGEAHCYRIKI